MSTLKIVKRDGEKEYEQYVMCEVLIPDTPNCYGDIYTRAAIQEFAFEFARQGYGIDIDHDETDVTGQKLVVVESFIAREGDAEFIEGSWVVGMKVLDDETWAKILNHELNGFSFLADCYIRPVGVQNLKNRQVSGVTAPDPNDGHTHPYLVILDPLNNVVSGATGVTDGHSHRITTHTTTAPYTNIFQVSHSHRYQVIIQEGNDDAESE